MLEYKGKEKYGNRLGKLELVDKEIFYISLIQGIPRLLSRKYFE